MRYARIGAVFYILWGVLHIMAAVEEFSLGSELERGVIQGKLNQGAWDLLFFSSFAITVAIKYNWKNDRLGYWLNLVVVSAADIGFLLFVFLPGYVPFFPGILGPVFWLIALTFTSLGVRSDA